MGFSSLPPEILRLVSQFLLRDETPSNTTLVLMAFCGVCRRWRDVGGETGEAALAFDSTDSQHGAKTTLPAFKKASGPCKRALFLGASRLLTGYSELTLSGEAINDQMLINIAVTNGPALSSLKLQGTPTVTDAGLCTLISAAPNIKLFSIEDAGQGVVGHFVPALLQHCKQLETLLIEGAESMDWPALRLSWAPAMAAAATAAQDADSPAAAAAAAGGRQVQQQQQQQQPSAFAGASSSRILQAQHHQQLQQASLSARDSAHDLHPSSSSSRGNSSRSSTAAQAGHMGRTQAQPNSARAGPSSSRHSNQPLQEGRLALPLAPRISSSSSCSGHSEFSSCQEEAVISDDGDSSSSSSVDARSDSTSISMPPQAVEALAAHLQQLLSPDEQQQQPAAAAAGEPGTVDENPSSSSSSSSNARAQAGRSDAAGSDGQQQQWRRRGGGGSSRPCHAALRRLRVRFANVDTLQQLLECVPGLTELQVDGPALSVQAAAVMCPGLRRLSYLVCSPGELDGALLCLSSMRNLRTLELEVKGMVISTEQLRVIGLLPLRELCLDSHAYRQHPSMPRPQYSHLDNDGVKGLVDSICSRMRTELMPLKLSLCGATALKQEAVSALLRLPILASIDTGGCVKLTPMDRMRLVAKVKAGQGLMDKTGAAGGAAGTAGGRLRLPHVLL